jgi:hypothetical protein
MGPGRLSSDKTTFASTPPTPGQRHDPAAQHPFEIRQVARDDPQAVVIEAQHVLHRLHLGDRGDRAFEILKADAALRGKFHAQKHRHAEAQRLEIEVEPPPR